LPLIWQSFWDSHTNSTSNYLGLPKRIIRKGCCWISWLFHESNVIDCLCCHIGWSIKWREQEKVVCCVGPYGGNKYAILRRAFLRSRSHCEEIPLECHPTRCEAQIECGNPYYSHYGWGWRIMLKDSYLGEWVVCLYGDSLAFEIEIRGRVSIKCRIDRNRYEGCSN